MISRQRLIYGKYISSLSDTLAPLNHIDIPLFPYMIQNTNLPGWGYSGSVIGAGWSGKLPLHIRLALIPERKWKQSKFGTSTFLYWPKLPRTYENEGPLPKANKVWPLIKTSNFRECVPEFHSIFKGWRTWIIILIWFIYIISTLFPIMHDIIWTPCFSVNGN